MFKKKKKETYTFDAEHQKPIIKSSICTGEKVAGFKNLETGKFTEIMLIKSEADLNEFRSIYKLGDTKINVEY